MNIFLLEVMDKIVTMEMESDAFIVASVDEHKFYKYDTNPAATINAGVVISSGNWSSQDQGATMYANPG